nr:uncharacterized protein LOC113689767 [Coffea arabica]
MAYELPTDLIQQLKRATRAEAGLSHYDPTPKSFPPLPSIPESVSTLDPSPPYLRCKNCNGRLLRGVQSLLCIYCGRPNDIVPDCISFKDTFAYRWLLESLNLDGSETVGPPLEIGDLNRGQSTPKVEISLSELLDFKISWPAEEAKGEINVSNQNPVERSYLKLTGINLDNFFHDSRRIDASNAPEEHSVTSNNVVTAKPKGVATHDNLSFFENSKPSELAVQSSTYQKNDAFSGWEADFQSANFGDRFGASNSFDPSADSAAATIHHESPKPPEPFGGSEVDISSHLDSVFGTKKESKDGRLEDSSAASPSIGHWTSDYLWNNSKLEASEQNEQPDPTIRVKDAQPQDNLTNVDLSLQLDSVFGPVKESKDGNQKVDLATSPSIGDWTSNDLWTNLNKDAAAQTEQHDATIELKDISPQQHMSNPSTSFDWFQVDKWQSDASTPANNMKSGDVVLFDDWNDFTSSTHVQDSQTAPTHSHEQSASESTSELNVFSSDKDLEEMDFGSFSQANPLPSSSSKGGLSAEVNNIRLEVSASDRVIDTKSDLGEGSAEPDAIGDVRIASTQTKEDVEMLLSQMHDLSFMLEDKLSVPPKSEGVNSFP